MKEKKHKDKYHFVILLYKYDEDRPTKNVDAKNKYLGKNPEAGNIFVVRNKKCRCDCGESNEWTDVEMRKKNARIQGGEDAEAHVFPWAVLIENMMEDDKKMTCGGTLISKRYELQKLLMKPFNI